MKIGILGNMNNMSFSLARYLIDYGFDCELLLYKNEYLHFHPSCDTYNNDFTAWCTQLSWGNPSGFLTQDFKRVSKDLAKFDFLIGNGAAPAFVTRIGRKLDIFIPYGHDLYFLPFFKMVNPWHLPAYFVVGYYQKKGIRNTPYIIFDKTNTEFEKVFTRLKYKGKRIVSMPPLLYHKEYAKKNLEQEESANPFYIQLKKIRKENDLVILQYIRQVWKNTSDPWSLKGNDLLIKGYVKFLKENPEIKSKLILFDYGENVMHTRKLIQQLNIESHVTWFPRMARKNIIHFIAVSDLVVGELFHSWLTYCVVLETLCLGKPLMHKRNDDDFSDDYPGLYPMIHASCAQTVADGLNRLINDKPRIDQLGEQAYDWFLEYCVDKPVNEVISIIKKKIETAG